MGRIAEKFEALRERGEKGLVTFITAGDPDLDATVEMIKVLEQSGADLIELGVPFSDPMADGPTIQKSSERALAAGTTLPRILETVRRVRQTSDIPILLMGYFNPIFSYGEEKFAADAAAAGVDGVLLVDLPPEEATGFCTVAGRRGIDTIFLLTPTADDSRIAKVHGCGSGFIYYVSVTGVTGARSEVQNSVFERVSEIRRKVDLPVAVGFGVSSPSQVGELAAVADAVVVGSAIVKLFEEHSGEDLKARLGALVKSLKEPLKRPAER